MFQTITKPMTRREFRAAKKAVDTAYENWMTWEKTCANILLTMPTATVLVNWAEEHAHNAFHTYLAAVEAATV